MKKKPSPAPMTSDRPMLGELERLGTRGQDALILGLEAPDFDKLPIKSRILSYFLSRAAIAGDNIMYMQNHRHGLEIKSLLETVIEHSDGMKEPLKQSVHDYLKYYWIHHGNYHHFSHTKFVPNTLTPNGLREAVGIATSNGAKVETAKNESVADKLARIEPTIFDPEFESLQSNQDVEDIVASSSVNFWDPGITRKQLDALPDKWKNKLNVRFALRNGEVIPETFKIGGVFGRELETVSHFLKLALSYCESDEQKKSIETLLDFYRTGDEELFRQHSIHWLKSDTKVDFLNGFVEQYIDPRGIIGSFTGNTSFSANETVVDAIADNATYFESKMPWPDEYKRTTIDRPVAKVVNVLVETGDSGPISPAAYNLPNYNDLRRDHGSKNVMLQNVERTSSRKLLEIMVNEFYLPEYRENILAHYQEKVRPLEVYMHEIIGHGSGRPAAGLTTDPRNILGPSYSPLEECRSDLVALYHISDPKLVEVGAIADADEQHAIVETAYITYTQGWLTRYDRIVGLQVREAHNKGHQLILSYLVEGGGDSSKDFGLEVIENGGKIFVRIKNLNNVRRGLEELLCKIQVIKSTGDASAAASLLERFGTNVNTHWHSDMTARLAKLDIPKIKAFVFPRLKPEIRDGNVVDVSISYDEDLTQQQLRFRRMQYSTDIAGY